eukprot:scaffold61233_cov66-Cyclotella_meneghiniana.AAC.3
MLKVLEHVYVAGSKHKAQHQLGIGSSYSITKQDQPPVSASLMSSIRSVVMLQTARKYFQFKQQQVATKKKREARPPRIIIVGPPIHPILKLVSCPCCRHRAVSINETIPSPS